jgi:hypothetical protein
MRPAKKPQPAAKLAETLRLEPLRVEQPLAELESTGKKRVGNQTARKAAQILVEKNAGFFIPTAKQKKNLVIAFVKQDMIVYGKAFDIVRLSSPVNLDDLSEVESKLDKIQLIEIKSTNKLGIGLDFKKYFFGLTGAEVLVAQSLKKQFKFVLVNTLTNAHIELDLAEMFGRAKGIYPTWSILL